MSEKTYVLYLTQGDTTIFLGVGHDPAKLYINALNPQTAEGDTKSLILKWLTRVEANLNEEKQREMNYTFMYTPLRQGCFCIKDLTLHIKRINVY